MASPTDEWSASNWSQPNGEFVVSATDQLIPYYMHRTCANNANHQIFAQRRRVCARCVCVCRAK